MQPTAPNQLSCPHCGQVYAVTPEQWPQYQGQTITCTRCARPFVVGGVALPPPMAGGYPQAGGYAQAGAYPQAGAFPQQGYYPQQAYPPPAKSGTAGWVIGLVVGIIALLFIGLLVSILLPALNRGREMANRVKCGANLKQIGMACAQYANQYGSEFPDSLSNPNFVAFLNSSQDLVCPSSNDTPAAGTNAAQTSAALAQNGHCSYIYVGAGMIYNGQHAIIAYEPLADHRNDGINVLYADGSVLFVKSPQAQAVIQKLSLKGHLPQQFHVRP